MSTQAIHPGDAALYPIREVSRLTGVNSVTLRAWERRYGLIRPQRTPKGHRLYAQDDIERIEQILQWLGRGVPVSQVRELLEQPKPEAPSTPISNDWSVQRQQWITAIEALDLQRLDELYNQSMALYPLPVCMNELFKPIVETFEECWRDQIGAALQRHSLESFLRTRVGIRLYYGNLLNKGPHLIISRLPGSHGMLWELLIALAAVHEGFRVRLFDASLPLSDMPLAVQRLKASALLLCSSQAERSDLIRRQLPRLAEQLDVPLVLCGPVARIRQADLADGPVEVLGDDPMQALQRLTSLLKNQ